MEQMFKRYNDLDILFTNINNIISTSNAKIVNDLLTKEEREDLELKVWACNYILTQFNTEKIPDVEDKLGDIIGECNRSDQYAFKVILKDIVKVLLKKLK